MLLQNSKDKNISHAVKCSYHQMSANKTWRKCNRVNSSVVFVMIDSWIKIKIVMQPAPMFSKTVENRET